MLSEQSFSASSRFDYISWFVFFEFARAYHSLRSMWTLASDVTRPTDDGIHVQVPHRCTIITPPFHSPSIYSTKNWNIFVALIFYSYRKLILWKTCYWSFSFDLHRACYDLMIVWRSAQILQIYDWNDVLSCQGALSSILSENGLLNSLIDQNQSGSSSSLLGMQPSSNGCSSAFASFGKSLSLGMAIRHYQFLLEATCSMLNTL